MNNTVTFSVGYGRHSSAEDTFDAKDHPAVTVGGHTNVSDTSVSLSFFPNALSGPVHLVLPWTQRRIHDVLRERPPAPVHTQIAFASPPSLSNPSDPPGFHLDYTHVPRMPDGINALLAGFRLAFKDSQSMVVLTDIQCSEGNEKIIYVNPMGLFYIKMKLKGALDKQRNAEEHFLKSLLASFSLEGSDLSLHIDALSNILRGNLPESGYNGQNDISFDRATLIEMREKVFQLRREALKQLIPTEITPDGQTDPVLRQLTEEEKEEEVTEIQSAIDYLSVQLVLWKDQEHTPPNLLASKVLTVVGSLPNARTFAKRVQIVRETKGPTDRTEKVISTNPKALKTLAGREILKSRINPAYTDKDGNVVVVVSFITNETAEEVAKELGLANERMKAEQKIALDRIKLAETVTNLVGNLIARIQGDAEMLCSKCDTLIKKQQEAFEKSEKFQKTFFPPEVLQYFTMIILFLRNLLSRTYPDIPRPITIPRNTSKLVHTEIVQHLAPRSNDSEIFINLLHTFALTKSLLSIQNNNFADIQEGTNRNILHSYMYAEVESFKAFKIKLKSLHEYINNKKQQQPIAAPELENLSQSTQERIGTIVQNISNAQSKYEVYFKQLHGVLEDACHLFSKRARILKNIANRSFSGFIPSEKLDKLSDPERATYYELLNRHGQLSHKEVSRIHKMMQCDTAYFAQLEEIFEGIQDDYFNKLVLNLNTLQKELEHSMDLSSYPELYHESAKLTDIIGESKKQAQQISKYLINLEEDIQNCNELLNQFRLYMDVATYSIHPMKLVLQRFLHELIPADMIAGIQKLKTVFASLSFEIAVPHNNDSKKIEPLKKETAGKQVLFEMHHDDTIAEKNILVDKGKMMSVLRRIMVITLEDILQKKEDMASQEKISIHLSTKELPVANSDKVKECAVLTIQYAGMGFSRERLATIFDPYRPPSGDNKNLGVDFSALQLLVEKHGDETLRGSCTVSSNYNDRKPDEPVWNRITITLPLDFSFTKPATNF